MRGNQPSPLNRRTFLRAAGGASTVVIAAASPIAATDAAAYDPGNEETKAKYQPDAADVRAFYRTNGYETLKK